MITKIKHQGNSSKSTNKRKPVIFVLIVLLIVLVAAAAFARPSRAGRGGKLASFHRVLMDTAVEIRFLAPGAEDNARLANAVFSEMERLETLFSRSVAESEVNRLNSQAGTGTVAVNRELFYLTEQALGYSRLTGGAFDPTIAPLIDLWGFLGQNYRLPAPEEIQNTLKYIGYDKVNLDNDNKLICLGQKNMALEFGGIAKGYIIDQALQILAESGVKNAFINAGGDIGLLGARPGGEFWRIGIRHPAAEQKIIAVIPVEGGAVVTSGSYERSFIVDGASYHHLLDPATGYPACTLQSVTILAPTALEADALSTAVFVMGPVRGLALIEELPQIEGLLITADLQVLLSSGLKDIAELNF